MTNQNNHFMSPDYYDFLGLFGTEDRQTSLNVDKNDGKEIVSLKQSNKIRDVVNSIAAENFKKLLTKNAYKPVAVKYG